MVRVMDLALPMPIDYGQILKKKRIALWPKHFYRGTVTMIAGPGGTGKGLTGIHATAVVTSGGLFPGESPDTTRDRTPGAVLGVWPEDDPEEDIAWRLDSALDGAGLTKAQKSLVYDMTETPEGEPFDLNDGGTESCAKLMSVIVSLSACDGAMPVCGCGAEHEFPSYPVRLVIIDPLSAVADTIQTNRQARKTMRPLMKLAKITGVAVLVVHHTVKDGKTIAGSKGLIDVLRLVFTVKPDKLQDDIVVLAKEKSNNLGHIPDLRYKIAGSEQEPYLDWLDATPSVYTPKAAKLAAVPEPGVVPAGFGGGRYVKNWDTTEAVK